MKWRKNLAGRCKKKVNHKNNISGDHIGKILNVSRKL